MSSNWDKFKKTVTGGLTSATVATQKYIKIGRSKLDILHTNKSLNDTFKELGIEIDKLISKETKEDIRHNQKVNSLIEKIKQLKLSIKNDKLEIDDIKHRSISHTNINDNTDNASDAKES